VRPGKACRHVIEKRADLPAPVRSHDVAVTAQNRESRLCAPGVVPAAVDPRSTRQEADRAAAGARPDAGADGGIRLLGEAHGRAHEQQQDRNARQPNARDHAMEAPHSA